MRAVFAVCMIAITTACPPEPEGCVGLDEAQVVQSLSFDADGEGTTTDAGPETYPIVVRATVPCFEGGGRAEATVSAGKVGGKAPGEKADIFLSTVKVGPVTELEGYSELEMDPDHPSRVTVSFGDASRARLFEVVDGELVTSDLTVADP